MVDYGSSAQELIAEQNDAFARGESTFTMGVRITKIMKFKFSAQINQFADMTEAEVRKRLPPLDSAALPLDSECVRSMRSNLRRLATANTETEASHTRSKRAAPASIDWRTLGRVTPVKNQASPLLESEGLPMFSGC